MFLFQQKEFDLNIDPMVARPILEKRFSQRYRTFKSTVRNRFLKKDGALIPKQVALNSRPDDIDKVWWQRFVDIEYSDKKKKQCKTNSGNKSKSTLTHTLGRKPYLKVYEELVCKRFFYINISITKIYFMKFSNAGGGESRTEGHAHNGMESGSYK